MELAHGWMILMVGLAVLSMFVIAASLWVLHSLATEQGPHGETAVDRLDGSFARGEISAEEYRRRRDAMDALFEA